MNIDLNNKRYIILAINHLQTEVEKLALEKKATFNNTISDYEAARPGYPQELFSDIISYSKINSDSKLLEVGSGTGQATDYFVKNSYHMIGLELGQEQANHLSNKYRNNSNFESVCSSFEDYKSKNDFFDMIISATAFHWIKPEIGYPKAYDMLKQNGTLAIWWQLSSIMRQNTEMFRDIREIYHKFAPELDTSKSNKEMDAIHQLRIIQFQTQNLFDKPITKIYKWKDVYSTEKYIKLLNTYSSFQIIDAEKRTFVLESVANYIERKGGKIEVPQVVRLYLSVKH